MDIEEIRKSIFEKESPYFWMRVNPLTKVVLAACCILLSIFLPYYVFPFIIMIVFGGCAAASGRLGRYLKLIIPIFLIFVVVMVVLRALLYGSGDIMFIFGIKVYIKGIYAGLSMGSFIMGLSCPIIFVSLTTNPEDLMLSLEGLHLSPTVTYVILATIQTIPQLVKSSETIQDAQKARGIETEGKLMVRAKAFLPMLLPLILSSTTLAEERSLALETRGFNAPGRKYRIRTVSDSRAQKIFRIAAMVVTIILCAGGAYIRWMR